MRDPHLAETMRELRRDLRSVAKEYPKIPRGRRGWIYRVVQRKVLAEKAREFRAVFLGTGGTPKGILRDLKSGPTA